MADRASTTRRRWRRSRRWRSRACAGALDAAQRATARRGGGAAGGVDRGAVRGGRRRRRRGASCCCSPICRRCSIAAAPELQAREPAGRLGDARVRCAAARGLRLGDGGRHARRPRAGVAAAEARLGYPVGGAALSSRVRAAARGCRRSGARSTRRRRRRGRAGVAATFVWALPQVMRDGFVHFDQEETMRWRSTMCCFRSRWGARPRWRRASRPRS